jgi:Na+/melibiose symporter-like transporter
LTNTSLGKIDLVQYSLLAIPLAFVGIPLYINLPDFYASQTAIPLGVIASIILIVRVFDAFLDPVLGWVNYRYSNLRPVFIAASVVMLCVFFYLLFHPSSSYQPLWLFTTLFMTMMAFSYLSIHYNSSGSLWTQNKNLKTKVTSYREIAGLLGLMTASVMPQLIGFNSISLLLSIMLIIAAYSYFCWLKKQKKTLDANEHKRKGKLDLKKMMSKPFLVFFLIFSISAVASAMPAALIIFYVRDFLLLESLTGLFLLIYFLSAVICVSAWHYLSCRTNKLISWMVSMVFSIAVFLWVVMLEPGNMISYAIICFLSGAALGAELILPPAILSEIIDDQKQNRQTSVYFSIHIFVTKLCLAVGTFTALYIVGVFGFLPNENNSQDALNALVLSYAILPCLIKLVAALLLLMSIISYRKGDINEIFCNGLIYRSHDGA